VAESESWDAEEPDRPEEGTSRPADEEWDENEPSPHEGEEEQEIA